MFSSYLAIALQSLKRHRGFSSIKILSLSIGLACSILVIMHVQYANSFDKHFPNWENTYRLVSGFNTDQRFNTELNSDAWAPQLLLDYPQIEHIAKISEDSALFSRGNEVSANSFFWAESDIIPIFSLQFISGDPATALNEPYTVVLNETTARKYFPNEEALGGTLTVDNQLDVRVTGVYKDLPQNTHLDFQMLAAVATGRELYGENFMGGNFWFSFQGTRTYLTLPDAETAKFISDDLTDFLERNIPDDTREFARTSQLRIYMESIGDIYLSPYFGFGGTNNRPQVLLALSIFSVLILLTSCINFANLSLSQIQQRSREIGVRKTLGAKRGQIILQFLFESLLLTVVALLIAAPFIYFAIPVYTNMTSTGFTLATAFASPSVLWLLLFVLATGLVSGLVPAFALAKFEPASIIKGISGSSRTNRAARSLVTVVQFGFSTSLVILAIAISLQISHLNEMDIGFDKDNLVVLNSTFNPDNAEQFNFRAMTDEIRQGAGIISVAQTWNNPPSTGPLNPWRLPSFEPGETLGVRHSVVDDQYLQTMGFTLLAGRNFSAEFPSDFITLYPDEDIDIENADVPIHAILLSRYGVSNFGFASPEAAIGEMFDLFGLRYRVVGVIDDFRFSGGIEDTLQSTQILRATQDMMGNLMIRIDPQQRQAALDYIDMVWERHRPETPQERTFFSQIYSDLVSEQTDGISKAAAFASIITVLISAFGLYALAFYSGQRRTKEVGVRKVLGASSNSIISLLTWDFIKPVLIACVLSWAVAWFAIKAFFQQFNSQVEISPLLYLGITLGTIVIAVMTVTSQCYKAANADPVDCLRYE